MYLCFLKFGFGRALQDAGIEIRRGSMNRDQAKKFSKKCMMSISRGKSWIVFRLL